MPTSSSPTNLEVLLTSLDDITSQDFDYVIVGAGTSGIALACRLAEDPSVTVAVLEAGGHKHDLDVIARPGQYGPQLRVADVVQMYETVPQSQLHNRSLFWPRGKVVGGTSAVNFFVFQKPPAKDINNWEALGSPGWNWERYHAAVKHAETFHQPSKADKEKFQLTFDADSHGTSGPIHTSYPKQQTAGEEGFLQAMVQLGTRVTKDPASGDVTGIGSFVTSIDPRTNTRSHAGMGYYIDAPPKSNLKLLTGATARRILLGGQKAPSENLVAQGVEFEYEGSIHTVRSKREVVLAAGALQSSALLELSGIGNSLILEPIGVEVKIHNPSVGENLQEHIKIPLGWYLDTSEHPYETVDLLKDPIYAQKQDELYARGEGVYLTAPTFCAWVPLSKMADSDRFSELVKMAEDRVKAYDDTETGHGLAAQYELQVADLRNSSLPEMEILYLPFLYPPPPGTSFEPGKAGISLLCGLNHPFSRGSIHIKSSDPHDIPRMDGNIYDHDIDLEIMVEAMKYCRKIASAEPFKKHTIQEVYPGPGVQSDEELREYLRANTGSTFHTGGPCSMLPREKGGVVDSSLKVYGTMNLRVCDLSIMPLQVAAHTQATAYAIAEQLADIMKNEAKLPTL